MPLDAGERKRLQTDYKSGAWTVSGALFGEDDAILSRQMERVRKHFENSGKAVYIGDEEARQMPHLAGRSKFEFRPSCRR